MERGWAAGQGLGSTRRMDKVGLGRRDGWGVMGRNKGRIRGVGNVGLDRAAISWQGWRRLGNWGSWVSLSNL